MARPVALIIVPLVAEAFRRPRWTDARADKPNRIGVDVAIDRVARGIADAAGGGQSGRVEGGRGGKPSQHWRVHSMQIKCRFLMQCKAPTTDIAMCQIVAHRIRFECLSLAALRPSERTQSRSGIPPASDSQDGGAVGP